MAKSIDATTGEILEAPPRVVTAPAAGGALLQVETQRAVAEIQARTLVARANPRNAVAALDAILRDCQHVGLAEDAAYQYARSGSDIRGASIRLVEAVARSWGNMASGIKEVFRHDGWSECVAFAWDLEATSYEERQFPVRHWRDTKRGGYAVTDERDIYELVANAGQRRKRSCLEAIIPRYIIDTALAECEKTLTAKADVSPEGMKKMLKGFAQFGVTREQIEARIQRRLDAIQPAQVVGLRRVYASLRDGISVVSDWFEPAPVLPEHSGATKAQPAVDEPKAPRKRAAKASEPPASQSGAENAVTTPPGPAAAGSAPEPRSLADYQIEIERATDSELAALVLDEARTAGLGAAALDALSAAWQAKFHPGEP
jgi:hypothetical protein